jgi:flagellar motor switch protein FliG
MSELSPPGLSFPDLMQAFPAARAPLNGIEKAAIVVRLLLAQGQAISLHALPENLQAALAAQFSRMAPVRRTTVASVADEFLRELESIGLLFPPDQAGVARLLGSQISDTVADQLRRADLRDDSDPWQRLSALDPAVLLPLIEAEAVEVAAVALSKVPVSKAAEILSRMPGDRARRIAYAVSQTSSVRPDTVDRIGRTLAAQLDTVVELAFETDPVERVGAILNFSPAATRDEVLAGLEQADAGFADQVRRAIFTFTHIATRIDARDIPKIVRAVDQTAMIAALAGAKDADAVSAEYILANMSQRMSASLREEMAALTKLTLKQAEAAQGAVVAAIRELETAGELFLIAAEEEDA